MSIQHLCYTEKSVITYKILPFILFRKVKNIFENYSPIKYALNDHQINS